METATPREDPLIDRLLVIIRWAVRALAVLMTFVIVMGVVDVVWMLYQRMTNPRFRCWISARSWQHSAHFWPFS